MARHPIKVLLIADNNEVIRLIRSLLAGDQPLGASPPSYEILEAQDITTAVAYLKNISFDIILLNKFPTDQQGTVALPTLAASPDCAPIIVLTQAKHQDAALNSVAQGVQDVLVIADLTSTNLKKAIHFATVRHQLLTTAVAEKTAAAEKAQQIETIVEDNADGIVIVNKAGTVLFVNKATTAILQKDEDELVGKPFSLPLPKKDTAEFNISRDNKNSAFIEMRLVEKEWEGERVYQASLRDITNHQRDKAAIREKAAELEVRNIALDEFAHTMAHQVQGLLSAVMGYASFMEMQYKGQLDGDFDKALTFIVQSGHKMNNVISELLLLASIRGEATVEPLNMQRVVAEAVKRLRYQIEKQAVTVDLPESWPIALGHGSWIEEAWVNYISNGIKYGGDPPRVELGFTELEDGMIRFWVRDNGIGIPEMDQKLLFKPHTRLGPKQVRGEGLGLSIVRRIVAKCGGEVGVESHEGSGSLFWFSLPQNSNHNGSA